MVNVETVRLDSVTMHQHDVIFAAFRRRHYCCFHRTKYLFSFLFLLFFRFVLFRPVFMGAESFEKSEVL